MLRFDCRFAYYPAPFEPNQFISPHTLDVICSDSDDGEHVVARLLIDQLNLTRAEDYGQDILDVCDSDSAGWESVFSSLFEIGRGNVELRRDFNFDDPIFEVLFLHRSAFHPAVESWQKFIIDHAARLFSDSSALVMWKDGTNLTQLELSHLGFRRIAQNDLLFRPNMVETEYDPKRDVARALDVEVSRKATKEFLDLWKRSDPHSR